MTLNDEILVKLPSAPTGFEHGNATTVRRVIDVPVKRVWEVISQPGHLALCHPFCEKNEVEQWPGVGARDRILYFSGLDLIRDFTYWEEGVGYRLEIGPPSGKTAYVIWTLTPSNENQCELAITIIPFLKSNLSKPRKRAYQRLVFGKSIRRYLDSVVKGVEHVAVTGERVARNQFGNHPIYSE